MVVMDLPYGQVCIETDKLKKQIMDVSTCLTGRSV